MAAKVLSIIIPCFNEERTVAALLDKVLAVDLSGWGKQVIVVDDASSDHSREILEHYRGVVELILRERNGGKGSAVRDGLAKAVGEYVLIQDADLEYEPADIPALLSAVDQGKAEVVYGTRNLRPSGRRGDLIPRLGVWFITKLTNMLWGLCLTDVWTCYKLFPREAGGEVRAGRFESELLLTSALARRGYRFVEVPITYRAREFGEGKKIRYIDGIWAIIVLILEKVRRG